MPLEFQRWEDGGFFGLSYSSGGVLAPYDDRSIGRGRSELLMRFASAEAREHCVLRLQAEHARDQAQQQYDWLVAELHDTITPTGRVRHKRLKELLARHPKESA